MLLALAKAFPNAPIYTAFYEKKSPAWARFQNHDVRVSWVHYIPFFAKKLHSPLRFIAPLIWNSFDFSEYDIVIGSASWYVTKGFRRKGSQTKELCYCHTPPRWLYGLPTSVEFQRFWLVRVYGLLVGHLIRLYDFYAAQRVDEFIANSKTVAKRIEKYYRRSSTVIYPPIVEQPAFTGARDDYYLIISRIVGGKGLDLAAKTAVALGLHLKIVGKPEGWSSEYQKLLKIAAKANAGKIEFLGFMPDADLPNLYGHAKAFLALASDEDFGMTPVESMMTGTPVIAYNGGGYRESVADGKTGILFTELNEAGLAAAVRRFEKSTLLSPEKIHQHALQFSEKVFVEQMRKKVMDLYDHTR